MMRLCLRELVQAVIAAAMMARTCDGRSPLTAASTRTGTPTHLQDIFMGRCWEYQLFYQISPHQEKDCSQLYSTFLKAFQYRPPCNASEEDYVTYIEEAAMPVAASKSMFWSNTFVTTHHLSAKGMRYTTLEDWFPGFLVQSLTFCGQTQPPGINYDSCESCGHHPNPFWTVASTQFALAASGEVTLVLNGSLTNMPAFRNSSYFAAYELPNLRVEAVLRVTALVVHNLAGPCTESCGTGSLITLRERVAERGIQYRCIDDPRQILFILCEDQPDAKECQSVKEVMTQCSIDIIPNSSSRIQHHTSFLTIIIASLLMIILRNCS